MRGSELLRVLYRHRAASRRVNTAATLVKLVYVGTLEECRDFVREFDDYPPERAYGFGGCWIVRANGAKVRSGFAAMVREMERFE